MDRIRALHEEGQSIWFDFIERSMLQSGGLQSLVGEGVVGVTSNPSIFQSAISGSDAYVDDLRTLAASGQEAKAIYEALAISRYSDRSRYSAPGLRQFWRTRRICEP